jgi:hypothetical protein
MTTLHEAEDEFARQQGQAVPPQEQLRPPIEIVLTPDAGADQPQEPLIITVYPHAGVDIARNQEVDSAYTIFTSGSIVSGGRVVMGDLAISIPGANVAESAVRDDMPQRSTQVPDRGSEAATGQTSSPTEHSEKQEGNELFEFVGNPVFEPIYRTWRDKQTGQERRKAIFALATNPTPDDPGYRRITAFDGLAAYVKNHVHKGQTGVAVEAWGPKHWTEGKKEVTGYYAKKVKVPRRYKQGQQH